MKYYLQQRSTVYNLISPLFYFYFIQKKVPLETILLAAERFGNLSISQMAEHWRLDFLCVFSLSLSLALVLSVYVREWTGKPHEGKRGSCPWLCLEVKEKKWIYIEAKANETSHTMQKVRWRWMRRAPIVPALHSATMRAWVYITQHTS